MNCQLSFFQNEEILSVFKVSNFIDLEIINEINHSEIREYLLSLVIKWIRQHLRIKYLFTWADGIVGKVGYVYQSANFLYGGFSETDLYVTENGEKVHPRTMQGLLPNTDGKKYGHRPNYEQRIDLNLKRVKGKQYKYIYPMNKDDREYLSNSTVDWTINYPKDDNLEWKVMAPGEKEWTTVSDIPFI